MEIRKEFAAPPSHKATEGKAKKNLNCQSSGFWFGIFGQAPPPLVAKCIRTTLKYSVFGR
ncbi:hypothetical protein A3D42_01695 [Candidatus Nomurabacteria bacterium RIFCSPHIGHO2_02_FULL_41_18]|uniref:Uncharacterized protein n=1 Tax=Candidatus Nomurabacteria bacterium RIFCSPHIGHO2_02_FULL_41_18 TaxID=1801754 RepID=A0A1F6W814_9BACT|nr:MAG: hypothetical protein A2737_01640 [Candidatus Nomurabacteria bacterium RIFCSPHIGHO2_01_FULL_41_71]OGI77974.1 MAG: hypothetical protein A3D42_01695 [Candidatus Nomurabacteria bacterium RIFCSPHIGHO2_02_FULL_41_18]OGI90253.1 MAG: hypothetical protein A3B01_03020 [Candidatus Nomurabacteria bacterium RIFCSPLOWO2_01_FULL_41_52b]OGJ00418.1 MAG: hypothetical protein A3I90_00825 [Candidatus Nomurabacteria bacterium RIFCSPLOWO2_02_FULL_41_9]